MSDITEAGREQVKDSLRDAIKKLGKVNKEYMNAVKRVEKLTIADNCPHENLCDAGSYMYNYTLCEDCGFTWQD